MKKKINIASIKAKYDQGVNIMQELHKEFDVDYNTPEIIEIAYDMQAGSYIDGIDDAHILYYNECADIISKYVDKFTTILDAGAGELTTTAGIANCLEVEGQIYAFDISWSRLYVGQKYFKDKTNREINVFIADLKNIPVLDDSIDLVYTNHALEPNRGSEDEILSELLRIANKRIVLFEPYYEAGTLQIKDRMDSHNYIKDLEGAINRAGGKLEEVIELKSSVNPLNPTYAFVVTPPSMNKNKDLENKFRCPVSGYDLIKLDSCYYSYESLLAYPIIEDIPILKSDSAIIASKMD
mgnify:CR=1 FL=1